MRLHSWLSPKCDISQSTLQGLGVFASSVIFEQELVAVWGGVIYSADEIQVLGESFQHFRTHPFEVAQGFYMGSTSLHAIDDAERFNHSCEPTVGVKGQVIVLARREINTGEELTFDYETTDLAPNAFQCRCGSDRCRRKIDGSAWRSRVFQEEHSDWLSWNVSQQIARE